MGLGEVLGWLFTIANVANNFVVFSSRIQLTKSLWMCISLCCIRLVLFLMSLFTGNHTFALIKGYEDYETLNTGFKNVRHAISKLVEQGYMEIDGNKVHLHFHLGGDYKVSEIHVLYGF